MLRALFALAAALACMPALASVEPGEWEFTSTTTSPMFPAPQKATFRQCIRKEDAQNPDRWMGQADQQGDCKVTPGAKSGGAYAWEMECPKAKLRGSGSARLSGATMEGETHLFGEVRGRKFEMRSQVTGRRVGPCKG